MYFEGEEKMASENHDFADTLLSELQTWEAYRGQIVSSHRLSALLPTYASVEEQVQQLLPQEISALYLHQAMTLEQALAGQHVTLATATASGKTLALALPARFSATLRCSVSLPRVHSWSNGESACRCGIHRWLLKATPETHPSANGLPSASGCSVW